MPSIISIKPYVWDSLNFVDESTDVLKLLILTRDSLNQVPFYKLTLNTHPFSLLVFWGGKKVIKRMFKKMPRCYVSFTPETTDETGFGNHKSRSYNHHQKWGQFSIVQKKW